MDSQKGLLIGYKHLVMAIAVILLFRSVLANYVSIFQYIDEGVAVVTMFILFIWLLRAKGIPKVIIHSMVCVFLLLIWGILSSLHTGLQTNKMAITLDVLSVFKFFPIFWGGIIMSSNYEKRYLLWKWMASLVRIFVFFAAIFSILNLFVDIGMSTDIRYGLRSFNFIFSRVGGLYTASISFLMIQLVNIYYCGNNRRKGFFLVLTLLVMCSTLRARAFAFAAMFIAGYLIFVKNRRYHFRLWHLVALVVVLVVVAFPQLQYYFIDNETQARAKLLLYSVEIAQTYFPFGSGFATYGTDITRTYGSALYIIYNFSNVYGLGKVNSAYLTDTYWPALIAQFGFIGAGLMALNFLAMTKYIIKKLNKNNVLMFAVLFQWFTILAASVATASVVNHVAGFFLMAIAVADSIKLNERGEEK